MGYGIGPGADIESIGIGEKRRRLCFPDGPDQLPDINGPDKRGVSLFSKMNFYGGEIIF